MKNLMAAFVIATFVAQAALLAVDSQQAQYVGGTAAGLKEKTEGPFSTQSETYVVFTSKKRDSGKLEIPYTVITSLEYGQKAGRRVQSPCWCPHSLCSPRSARSAGATDE